VGNAVVTQCAAGTLHDATAIFEAQDIVEFMIQANRSRQHFNPKLGQPPNLYLPFPLD
jgi:hypothetical protein